MTMDDFLKTLSDEQRVALLKALNAGDFTSEQPHAEPPKEEPKKPDVPRPAGGSEPVNAAGPVGFDITPTEVAADTNKKEDKKSEKATEKA